jgi:hypothetical protein
MPQRQREIESQLSNDQLPVTATNFSYSELKKQDVLKK